MDKSFLNNNFPIPPPTGSAAMNISIFSTLGVVSQPPT